MKIYNFNLKDLPLEEAKEKVILLMMQKDSKFSFQDMKRLHNVIENIKNKRISFLYQNG